MNVTNGSSNMFSVFRQRFGPGSMCKSAREQQERQEKAQSQIDYWENQKENLKNTECDTVEEIARKLEKFHSYEDAIAAAKQAYNFEQMYHVLDEAQEQGEKIAEAAEKTKPKTEEERKKEALEEATGAEDTGGVLDEMLDEMLENVEEITDVQEILEDVEEMTEELSQEAAQEVSQEGAQVPDTWEKTAKRQAERLAREHQRNQELAERYMQKDRAWEAEEGRRLDYRM